MGCIYAVFMSVGSIIGTLFTMYDTYYQGEPCKDRFKKIILLLFFAPFHLNLIGYPLLLGLNDE